ncbi:type II secretion system protein GspL [Candidatus Parabeggiatoa sp. HSG14]|uniref:type II secretion system protein GspL n=1 Tax=Candidatus Parabeggiatoa sp. HSG14 TaxID=3055593 RepID=UPI0025A91827|nr:type II secretion system protein GspL [Thiotrichales bacterium HSG14]
MRTSLLIHLYGDANQQVSWATFNSAGDIIESATNVPIDSVPRQHGKPFVLIPSTEVVLTQTNIPSKQWQRIVQAVPYALEEQLAEDVENLHFALGKRVSSSGNISVAVIDRTLMDGYLQQLRRVEFIPMLLMPNILAVPKPPNGWGILFFNKIVLVRTGLHAGFAIEMPCLNIALRMALLEVEHENEPPQKIVVFRGTESVVTLTELHALGIPIIEKTHEKGVLAWLIKGLNETKPLNLLQGDCCPQDKIVTLWQPWRLTAMLLILWGGLLVAKQGVEYQHLKQQRHALHTQIEKIYRETFPKAHKIVNPQVQMEQKLRTLRTQQGNISLQSNFLSILNQISVSLARAPGFNLKRIDFRQGHFDVQLSIANLQALEYLKKRLSRLGLTVEIPSATSHNNQVKSRLRIYKNH